MKIFQKIKNIFVKIPEGTKAERQSNIGIGTIKNPAVSGEVNEKSRDGSMNSELVLNVSIANPKNLSRGVRNFVQKGRGSAGNRTPEAPVPTRSSDHPGPTADILYRPAAEVASALSAGDLSPAGQDAISAGDDAKGNATIYVRAVIALLRRPGPRAASIAGQQCLRR